MSHRRRAVAIGVAVLALGLAASAAEYAWLEGEQPAACSVEPKTSGWGNQHYLSGERWLSFSIPEGEVAKTVPEDGIIIRYPFALKTAGRYEVWNRIGFEFVRSPFDWRLDGGAWQRVEPTDLTTDLMEISFWCEVAWLEMGEADLKPGQHALEIRLPITYKDEAKKQPNRILYASDALCVHQGRFRPNSGHKPDANWQSDRDRQAAAHVFQMPAKAAAGERTELSLAGLWQLARYDEPGLVEGRTEPIAACPEPDELFWSSIEVPGDRNALRPDHIFCHRYFYRTRVNIPEQFKGQSFFLDFTETSMLATVFVNGQRVAFHDAPLTGFLADITSAVEPGAVNELWVGIKDAYYAIEPNEQKPNTRLWFNIPLDLMNRNQGVTMRFDFPMKGHLWNGITDTVKLVATGPAYTTDVFTIPSVANRELTLEVSVRNPTERDLSLTVLNEVVPLEGGKVARRFEPHPLLVPAGTVAMLRYFTKWPNPRLWWPDDPHQYEVVTRLTLGGKVVDTKRTKFGFREWSIRGRRFALNGVPWQMRANLDYYGAQPGEADEAVTWWRQSGQNMFRLRFQKTWAGMTQNQALDFFDAHGVPVRRTCSTFDGQHASYGLVRFVQRDGKRTKVPNAPLFENWRRQIAARVRQQRNHPSIFVWELDNEIIFINTRNFGNLDVVEPEFTKASHLILAMDPSGRGTMVAGGRALVDQSLPINGCHYEASPDRDYPDMAYGLGGWTATSNWTPWPMAKAKPIFLSEEFYAHGRKPAAFAGVGGERCFLGRAETKDACGLLARMYSEGYRWQGLGAFHYWFGRYGTAQYNAWQPVVALCRQWNWTFAGGSTVARTLKVLNDTRFPEPIDVAWELRLDGKPVAQDRKTYRVAPGMGEETEIAFRLPKVAERTAGELVLTCFRGGKQVWSDTKPVRVIDPDAAPKPKAAAGELLVWDPHGTVTARLKQRAIAFTAIDDPEKLPSDFRLLVIGRDALTPRLATDQRWYQLAAQGKRILVLDQAHPLHYQAVPADFEVTDYVGRIAFAENLDHPVFAGLDQPDFFCWSGDHVVYRHVYRKASRGARSLAQCDDQLSCSAIAECTVNDGLLLLCQMVVGEKLPTDPVAQRLFDNLLNYAAAYRLVRNTTAVALDPQSPRGQLLERSGLEFTTVPDALAAIQDADNDIVIADASPSTLKRLAAAQAAVRAFTARGGWLMLWGLTPEGLADFNALVGHEHLLRPFRIEKVALATPRDPLASGLSQRDVVLLSGRRIFGWRRDEYVADDVFTHVVDLDDIAPFMTGPGIEGTGPDRPDSIVNGFTSVEAWKYIRYFGLDENNKAAPLRYELPRRETLVGFSIVPNTHYHTIRKLRLVFDDDRAHAIELDIRPVEERQDFEIPARAAKALTLEILDMTDDPQGRQGKPTGIDNLWIRVQRPDGFRDRVKPLLNLGGLVRYPRGKGGILLNQLLIKPAEAVPINAQKKQAVVATLLRNLHAVFAGRKTLLPGAGLSYAPVSLEGRCNVYLTADRGWPDKQHDLSHLPLGRQRFNGVAYEIRDFKTSPLEHAVALAGLRGVKAPRTVTGLEVNRKADALFFLHAFVRRSEWRPRRGGDQPPVLFQYVVHYADGKSEAIDVRYGLGAAHWITDAPKGLRDAALAWAAPFPRDPEQHAALYQLQWNNPRPDVPIKAIDLKYHDQVGSRYGTPVLLALTAAEAIK